MKNTKLRMIALLLTLVMLLAAFPVLADSQTPMLTTEVPVEATPEASVVPETSIEPEASIEPETSIEPEASVEPETSIEPEVSVAPEVTAEPEATEAPAATEEPADEGMTTSPVDNSTSLPDGEYVPSGCTGGSGKVKFSCPKVTVKGGKASATLVISSSKYDYVKASGSKYATAACSGGVCADIPVALNRDNRIVGHTTAMGGKEIEYTICITLDESAAQQTPAPTAEPTLEPTAEPTIEPSLEPTSEPTLAPDEGEDTEHSVETDNKMFKIVSSKLTKKDGRYSARIVLSSTGYDKLYMGTAAQAASDSANWIAYSGSCDYTNASGEAKTGYVFNIPVAAVNTPIPVAAYSTSKAVWYDRNVTFTVKQPEQPDKDTEHTVETTGKMFSIIRSRLTEKNGVYSAEITLSGTGYDMLYLGTAAQAATDSSKWIAYSATYDYTNDAGAAKTGYVFKLPAVEVNVSLPLAAHSASSNEWKDRSVTFHVATSEPTPTPSPAPSATPTATPVTVATPAKVNSSTTLADGTYSPDKFSWSGGSGRTSISCSKVTVKGGKAYATISFSSDSYGYVKASGSKYYGSVVGGRSTFEIPVKLNANNKIVGMTSAMSADHEIAYTIYVYIAAANETADAAASPEALEAQLIGLNYVSSDKIDHSKFIKIHRYEGGYVSIVVEGADRYLIVSEGAELPVGIEQEASIIQQPIMSLHSGSDSALDMISDILSSVSFATPEEAPVAAWWDTAAPNYAALLTAGSDLVIVPETFAEPDAGEELDAEAAAAMTDVRERLELLGVPMLVDRSTDEEDEGGRLEWLKVYGILLGCENEAQSLYEAAVAYLLEVAA